MVICKMQEMEETKRSRLLCYLDTQLLGELKIVYITTDAKDKERG